LSGSRRLRDAAALALAALAAVAVLAGCSPKGPAFVDAGNSYDQTSVAALAESVDTTALAGTPSEKAEDLRHDALTALRSRGGSAVAVADMVTKTFSAETRAVPVYFERATFNGKPAVIMVEAAGPAGGTLSARRIWVLDEEGGVLFMGSSR